MSNLNQYGVTALHTRRQQSRVWAWMLVVLIGLPIAITLAGYAASMFTGDGGGLRTVHPQWRGLMTGGALLAVDETARGQAQWPVVIDWPATRSTVLIIAAGLWMAWIGLIARPILRGLHREARHLGLAPVAAIRARFSTRAARRTGKVTFPASNWLQRALWPASAFGFTFGAPLRPKARGLSLRAGWETRTRIIARPGWGKTLRLLVPIIRDLPGAAMVTSTEPQIFAATVQARQYRRPLVRWAWLRIFPSRRRVREYPVAVVDITAPDVRYAAGYPQVRWNPILGCADYLTADRRATALVHATDAGSSTAAGENDAFFRQAAIQVLAAWLHAAALDPHVELTDLREWLETSNTAVPAAILDAAGARAEPTAKTNMLTHLDPAAERTTSGVKRYVSFALASVTSGDGQRLCGSRREAQFEMESFILAGGTLYVLAQNERMASARPVLSMFANEVFTAAENAALRLPARRLSAPFIGVIDELRYGMRISSLPYVAASMRKYGIGYIYAAQSSAQEEQVYGEHAARELRDAAGLSIHGGFDTASASGVTDRAGRASVVTAGRGHDGQSHESVELQEALSVADQQQLADGESVILGSGIKVFLAHTDAYYEHRRQRRRIGREAAAVTARVARARDGQNAWTEAASTVRSEPSGARS